MTSWRSGRQGRNVSPKKRGDDGPGRRVPKTERAEGAGAGLSGLAAGLLRLAQQQQVSQSSAWPSHASAGRGGPSGWSDWCDSSESLDSATSPDASASSTRKRHRCFGIIIGGEFDPGSGSTLAACLMHASRARAPSGVLRGGRVRNTWATCPGVGDSRGKPRVIPHTFGSRAES